MIGGTAAGAGNVISANPGGGISIGTGSRRQQSGEGQQDRDRRTGSLPSVTAYRESGIDSPSNVVGGTTAAERNVISGNQDRRRAGFVFFSNTTGNAIRGNHIGTDATGTVDLGNSNQGVVISDGSGNSIGGLSGAGNVISGNNRGVHLSSSGANNTIQGNMIGTDAAGTATSVTRARASMRRSGLQYARWAAPDAGEENRIAFNGTVGVDVNGSSAVSNRINRNSIESNGGLGIDLGSPGVRPNDPGDGGQRRQHAAELPGPDPRGAGQQHDTCTARSTPSRGPTALEFFSSSTCDPSGFGEGRSFEGSKNVTVGSEPAIPSPRCCTDTLPMGEFVTATATDSSGNTSEFSACVAGRGRAAMADLRIAKSDSPDPCRCRRAADLHAHGHERRPCGGGAGVGNGRPAKRADRRAVLHRDGLLRRTRLGRVRSTSARSRPAHRAVVTHHGHRRVRDRRRARSATTPACPASFRP